jgi:thiamine monophosphate kinase
MLQGGEDYELLFTADRGNRDLILEIAKRHEMCFYRVGRVVQGSGVLLIGDRNRRDISYQGYRHLG